MPAEIAGMFALERPLWDIGLRSTIAYLALVALIRIVPKRNAGRLSPNDMLVLVVVGSIGSDAIMAGAESLVDTMLMIALILLLGYALDFLQYHVPFFGRMMRHDQTPLMKDGRFLRRNMRREMVTEAEMRSALRLAGVEDIADVHYAMLEAEGDISVIRKKDAPDSEAGEQTGPRAEG